MIKTHSNKMGYTKPCSHLIPSSTIHSHPLVSTPAHFHPLYSFLTLFHSFSALFHAHIGSLLLILNPHPPMCSLSHRFTVYMQILSPNLIHHLPFQPMLIVPVFHVPTCFMCICSHVSLSFTCPYAYVIHFYGIYCLCLYTYVSLCVLISQDYLFTLRF